MTDNMSRLAIMSALAVETAFTRSILPRFEQDSGLKIDVNWAPTTILERDIQEGKRGDVLVATDSAIGRLTDDGTLDGASRVPIARAVLGLAVKGGAPKPDISSVAAFKAALLEVKSIAVSQAGASGIYFRSLVERLGIADAIEPKLVTIPQGFTAELVVRGEAELAVQQISELMTISGIDIVGPFPEEVQVFTDFSAAAFSNARNRSGARVFLEALATPEAVQACKAGGLVPRPSCDGAAS